MVNEYRKEKQALEGLEQAEAAKKRKDEQVCDWSNAEEVSLYRAEKRLAERELLLDSIVPTRVCPNCKRMIWLDSSWVVDKRLAVCKSCSSLSRRRGGEEEKERRGSIGLKASVRFEIDGWKVRSLRERVGVGANSFAQKMGYSRSYQWQLENNKVKSLSLELAEKFISVFEELGVEISDII